MAKHDRTGRSKGEGRFAGIPHAVMDSPGYGNTHPPARAVLLELVKRYSGYNNGRIVLSVRDAAKACRIGSNTAARALSELEACGLIECMAKGAFRLNNRQASEYRLLWRGCDKTGVLPTRRYMDVPLHNDEP